MHRDDLLRDLFDRGPYERRGAPWRVVTVRGPDAGEFLQRLCSQDVATLAEGALAPAAFLDAKGKLLVTCRIARVGGAFVLETHADQADRLAALLDRYHFTEKLTLTPPADQPCTERVERIERAEPAAQTAGDAAAAGSAVASGDGYMLRWQRRGVLFTRWHGVAAPAAATTVLEPERAECLRMLAGELRVGVETEPATLALEADLDDHISTTKGCYTGQEIVARIHTYGHVNRKACLLWLAPGAPITTAQPLHELDDRLAVGRVLHAVPVPGHDGRLGVGYLPRDFQALGTKLALADASAVEVIGWAPLAGASG